MVGCYLRLVVSTSAATHRNLMRMLRSYCSALHHRNRQTLYHYPVVVRYSRKRSCSFLILAADTIGEFNPWPYVFRLSEGSINTELVIAFGLFAIMMLAKALNWLIGGSVMYAMGIMALVPKHYLLPIILPLTLYGTYKNVGTCAFSIICAITNWPLTYAIVKECRWFLQR